MKVLFVCRANVGRSQMAEGLYNKRIPGGSDSAGTIVENEIEKLKDRFSAINAVKVMQEIGVDMGDNTRTQVTAEMLDNYDKIIVMAEPENIPDYIKNHPNFEYWEIEDAKDKSLDITRRI